MGVSSTSYPNQAIGAASNVSPNFARDQTADGLMGLLSAESMLSSLKLY